MSGRLTRTIRHAWLAAALAAVPIHGSASSCPYATVHISGYRYPVGVETYVLCPTVLQYTAPIHFAAGVAPSLTLPWDHVWELPAASDDVYGPLALVPPCSESSLLVSGIAALATSELCVTSFRYLPPNAVYEGAFRSEGLFRSGFESAGTLFANGFEGH
mgnify:CR=1 FL=1